MLSGDAARPGEMLSTVENGVGGIENNRKRVRVAEGGCLENS